MGWARALGEFGATITFAGNMPGMTQTMPLAVYLALQSDWRRPSCSRSCCSPSRSPCSSPSGWPVAPRRAGRAVLDALLGKHRGEFTLDVAFQAEPGTTTVLVGESGAGKTTVLRLVAGSRPAGPRAASTVGAERYADARRGLHRTRWQRDIGYVAQDYALFPHLSVFDNVAFGLRASGMSGRRRIRSVVEEALEPASALPRSRGGGPHQLSGGQQQRGGAGAGTGAPARACCCWTSRSLRSTCRPAARSGSSSGPCSSRLPCVTLYVTHSPVEALVFGDQIVVLEQGQVAQAGTREDLLPRSPLPVRGGAGRDQSVRGSAGEGGPRIVPAIRTPEASPGGDQRCAGPGAAFLTVSPREITLSLRTPETSAQNVFAGHVIELIPEPPGGERVRVVLNTRPALVAEVTREAVSALTFADGTWVYAAFKATGVHRYA